MLDEFARLGEFYPGSRERRSTSPAPAAGMPAEDLLGPGMVLELRGQSVEFYTIGQVARAIGRQAGTLRKWETDGILPPTIYQKPSKDPRGRRRLYSRAQADGIIRLAIECGVMDAGPRHPLKDFSTKVWALFNELKGRQC